jgi:hypothetical protein
MSGVTNSVDDEHNEQVGAWIVALNAALTVAFAATAGVSTVVFAQPWKAVGVAVAVACFAVGVVAFLWGYWSAVQRSRHDEISVAALYFLVDKCAPARVARRMNTLLGAQVVIGLATAIARSSTDGKPGSTLAFGILVPMLGLGLNGLWGAHHGRFRPRITGDTDEVRHDGGVTGQDESHD